MKKRKGSEKMDGFMFVFSIFIINLFINETVLGQTASENEGIKVTPTIVCYKTPVPIGKYVIKNEKPITMHDYFEYERKNKPDLSHAKKALKKSTKKFSKAMQAKPNLQITQERDSALLKWNSVPEASSYNVYISEDGINYKRRKISIKETSFLDGSVMKCDKKYYFGVTSFGQNGESEMAVQQFIKGSNKEKGE